MSTIGLQENGISVRVVELPKSDRKIAPIEKTEKVALTGRATDEIEGIKALETMFKTAVIGYARKQTTLFDAVKTCKEAGVSDAQLVAWAKDVGFAWSMQTFANTMSRIRKENDQLIQVVKKDDRRLARNRKTPAESSLFDRVHAYMLRECGTLAASRKLALALARQFEKEIKDADKAAK